MERKVASVCKAKVDYITASAKNAATADWERGRLARVVAARADLAGAALWERGRPARAVAARADLAGATLWERGRPARAAAARADLAGATLWERGHLARAVAARADLPGATLWERGHLARAAAARADLAGAACVSARKVLPARPSAQARSAPCRHPPWPRQRGQDARVPTQVARRNTLGARASCPRGCGPRRFGRRSLRLRA